METPIFDRVTDLRKYNKNIHRFIVNSKDTIKDGYESAIKKLHTSKKFDLLYSPIRLTPTLSVCHPAPVNTPSRKFSLTSRPSQTDLLYGDNTVHPTVTRLNLSNCLCLDDISNGYFTAHIKFKNLPNDDILLLAYSDYVEVLGRGNKDQVYKFDPLEKRSKDRVRRSDYDVRYGYVRLPVYVDTRSCEFDTLGHERVALRAPIKGMNSALALPLVTTTTQRLRSNTIDVATRRKYVLNAASRLSI